MMQQLTKDELYKLMDELKTSHPDNINFDDEDREEIIKNSDAIYMVDFRSSKFPFEKVLPILSFFNDAINGVYIHFKMHPKQEVVNVIKSMDEVHNHINDEIDMMFGVSNESSFLQNEVQITVIVSLEYKNSPVNKYIHGFV